MNFYQLKAYLKYKLKAKYRKGHRVHPPFAFDLIRHYFFEKHPFYHFETIESIRKELLASKEVITVSDLGAGSKVFRNNKRRISNIVKYNSTSQQEGELIFRMVALFKPQTIIEIGTSLGIGTLYLSLPNTKAKVFTLEGCPTIANHAQQTFTLERLKQIKVVTGNFENTLPKVIKQIDQVDMVYFDGNHNYAATIGYFKQCLSKASESAVFIFDDINWSEEMTKAWNQIIAHPQVSVSFDLFRMGICILNKKIEKQHYIVAWP